MAKTNKDVIKAIYKDEDLFDTMESLVQLWADRELYVKKLLMENVDNNADFKDHENKKIEYWSVYAWPTKINDDLFIYIYDGCNFGFATNSNRAITESEIIDFVPKDMVFRSAKKIERQDSEKHWFYWRIDLKSKTVIEDTIKNLKTLLELAGK